MTSEYITLQKYGEAEFTISRSRFIGRAFPVKTEEEALTHLAALRKQHYDATHNCYAYRIGETAAIARFSDDGEPQGTAGLPMMEALRGKGPTFALVVVTRYFGGILLGAGGLVRAYSRAASEAVDNAGLQTMRLCDAYSLTFGYERIGRMSRFLQNGGYDFAPFEYGAQINARVFVPKAKSEAFCTQMADLTAALVVPSYEGEVWRAQ